MAEMTEFPFEISPMFEGERIRKDDLYIELAGPKAHGFELVRAVSMDEIEDEKFTLIGKDISEMEEGSRSDYAMIYKIAGELVESDLEAIVERRNHDFQNYIQGYMHLNQRYDIWVRISKDAIKKGLNSFEQIAKATMMLFKNELPFIEKIEAVYITDSEEVQKQLNETMTIYEARDQRTRDLHDEDVDVFYGCTLCQSFAPTNVCVISPDRVSLCGAINWFDGRAAAKVDPEGPQFAIEKGECIDKIGGEYTGVNEKAVKLSGGEYDRIKLHSFFEYPHTSCCTHDTEIIVNREVVKIGDLVDSELNKERIKGNILSLREGKAVNEEYFLVQKLEAPEKLIKISTKSGLSITLTPDHKIPVDRIDGLKWIETEKLMVGDRILALKNLKIKGKVPYIIDFLPEDAHIIDNCIRDELKNKLKEKYRSLKKAYNALNLKQSQFYCTLSIETIKICCNDLNMSWNEVKKRFNKFSLRSIVEVNNPKITTDLMYIAGLIASDGAITKRGKYQYTITFVNTNKKLISAYEIYKKIFPERNLSIDLKDSVDSLIEGRPINYTGRSLHSLATDCYACSTSNPIFGLLLENLGIKVGENGDWNLHRLLSLSDELIASFIRGYFDGDGSVRLRVNKNWNEKWKSGEIYLAISDEKSAGHLQLLLKRLGIVSHVRKDNTVYRVEIYGNKNLIRFANIVGSRHPEKAMKLREIKEYYKKTAQDSKNVTSEILPYFAGKLVSEVPNVHNILSESTLYYYKTGRSREEGDVKSISELPTTSGSVGILTHPISKLKTILDSDYFLDEIKTIESIKPKDKYVYNLTVADTHCYFANQILIKNCGCFEVVGFYMPELDGIGWVDRDFSGIAPNGLPFSTMAGQTGGGKQIIGFLGVGVNYFRSPKFIQADGGWNRVVWMTKHLKDRVLEDIPKEIVDAIATEEEAKDLDSLKNFLIEKKHPILDRWKKEEEELKKEEEKEVTPMKAEASAAEPSAPSAQPFIPMPSSQLGGSSSIKLILKNAKISIERIVIKRK